MEKDNKCNLNDNNNCCQEDNSCEIGKCSSEESNEGKCSTECDNLLKDLYEQIKDLQQVVNMEKKQNQDLLRRLEETQSRHLLEMQNQNTLWKKRVSDSEKLGAEKMFIQFSKIGEIITFAKNTVKDDNVRSGLEMIDNNFLEICKKLSIERVGKIGDEYNSNEHEVLGYQKGEKDKITEIIAYGYKKSDGNVIVMAKIMLGQD